MVGIERIRNLADRIVREFSPERIILFGSHARGDAGEHSDVDLLVILPFEGKGARKAVEIRHKVRPGFAVDLVCRTPEQVRQRLEWGDFFLREVMEQGKVLHESAPA